MFLDSLSTSLLQICDAEHLSYKQAAERCDCSSKHFANIVRRRTYPSLKVFENICSGFNQTPDRLLGIATAQSEELSFRFPKPVTELHAFRLTDGVNTFPSCPRCHCTLERDFQSYCDRCGQCLDWSDFHRASVILHL